jgi:hypothetical protein
LKYHRSILNNGTWIVDTADQFQALRHAGVVTHVKDGIRAGGDDLDGAVRLAFAAVSHDPTARKPIAVSTVVALV